MSESGFGEKKNFTEHLDELKVSLKHSFYVFAVLLVFFFVASESILRWMQADINIGLHGLTPFEVLNVRIGIAAILGLIFALPAIFNSFLSFAKPGLKHGEYRILRNYLPVAYILFIVGSFFSYEVIFKNAVNFFVKFTESAGVDIVWGLSNTLMLGLRISVLTGLMFQMPLVILISVKAGLVSTKDLKKYRPHVVVGILSVSALATPPDILTQIMITIPVFLLYEASIMLSRRF
jgi:sec-independent protein translocase protein TatC